MKQTKPESPPVSETLCVVTSTPSARLLHALIGTGKDVQVPLKSGSEQKEIVPVSVWRYVYVFEQWVEVVVGKSDGFEGG